MHLADAYANFPLSPLNGNATIDADRIVTIEPKRKKVCIYGAGLFRKEAPLLDPEFEVWALNLVAPIDAAGRLRADRWFDIHQRVAQTKDDIRWIGNCPFPIYVPPDLLDAGANCVPYPLDVVEDFFGVNYWACTFAYQIALALYEGFEEIGLYGVELAYGTQRERTLEFANTAYWLGRAAERGVKITTPKQPLSLLVKHPGRYGFEYNEELKAVKEYSDWMDEGDAARKKQKDSGVNVGG